MSEMVVKQFVVPNSMVDDVVKTIVKIWYVIAALGHWVFLGYILVVFYPPIAQHGLEGLKGMHLPAGFREGDTLGNFASVSHVVLAAIIIGGGPLQLLPSLRNRHRAFHRWLGRSYLVAALFSSVVGLYMTWTRSEIGDWISQIGISVDGVLIIVFAIMTVRYAVARRFELHRRWAMRLFMVSSAVWFFRVALMAWATITGGVGIDWESFTGPFLYALGFADYLLPLMMLEWYFYCQRGAHVRVKMAFALTLGLLTIFMVIGIFSATMVLWLPRI